MEKKPKRIIKKSFYDWCVENNRMDLNDRFDEEKNGCTTRDVNFCNNDEWWFECQRGLHESELHKMSVVTRSKNTKIECNKCNSIAQVVIDKFGEDYLWSHWHYSNIISPWDISYGNSREKIILQCTEKDYHIYPQTPQSFGRGIGCPYCNGKMVHPNDSVAVLYPDIIDIWSDKNEKSPYEYTLRSNKEVWFKCALGKHDDYPRVLNNAFNTGYGCPECNRDATSKRMTGSGNYFWKGGINGENDTLRHRREYKDWRTAVYERDNYTCQCCGQRGGRLNAHHINQFANYPELRYDVNNGITLCTKCHDSTEDGSFHNIYGTHDTNASQLRQYILDKSNKDIYITNPDLLYDVSLLLPSNKLTIQN